MGSRGGLKLVFTAQPLAGIGEAGNFEDALRKRVHWYRSVISVRPEAWIQREDGHKAFSRRTRTSTISATVTLRDQNGADIKQLLDPRLTHIPLSFSIANFDVQKVQGRVADVETPPSNRDGVTPPVVLSDKSEALSIDWDPSISRYREARIEFRVQESSRTRKTAHPGKPANRPYFKLRVAVQQDLGLAIQHVDSKPFICRSKKNKKAGAAEPAMVTCYGDDPTHIADEATAAGKLGPGTVRETRQSEDKVVLQREVQRLRQQVHDLQTELSAIKLSPP